MSSSTAQNDKNKHLSLPQSKQNLSLDPTSTWRKIKQSQEFADVPTINSFDCPWGKQSLRESYDATRIVCMSDTHGEHRDIHVPKGDVLIHGGDFTRSGEVEEILDLLDYFHELKFPSTVCIAGNHDLTLDLHFYHDNWQRFHNSKMDAQVGRDAVLDCSKNTTPPTACISSAKTCPTDSQTMENSITTTHDTTPAAFFYLEDATCEIPILSRNNDDSKNLCIHGSPWSATFHNWAFNVPRGQPSHDIWKKIPDDTDILITHGPPLGRGDLCKGGVRAGCYDLMCHVQQRVRPRLHVFGHIHEDYGTTFDGQTLYVNASNLDLSYKSVQPCIVIDLPHDPKLPPRVVVPHCTISGVDWLSGQWLRSRGYIALADCLKTSGCQPNDLPTGNDFLSSADVYRSICKILKPDGKASMDLVRRELRRALSQLYAESFA